MAHGRRKVPESQFKALLDAYRQHPEAHALVARAAKVDPRTAARAWREGLMGHEGHAPIRKLIEDEQIRARTRKVDMEMAEAASAKEARDKARNDAVEQHAKEGRLASGGLNNAILGTGIAAGVLGAAFKAVPWVVKQLEACAKETDAVEPCKACSRPMPPGHVLGLLERAVRLASNALEHNRDAVELMRLHFGEPQKLIGISAVQDLGPEEMEVALQRMLESVRASKAAAAALKPSIMPKAEVN